MSDLNINNITDRTGDSGPVIAGISTVSSGQFVVPVGPTEFRGGRGRGIFSNGRNNPVYYNRINLVEIATTGNAIDFGDTIAAVNGGSGNISSSTRGLVYGGYEGSPGANVNYIEYITMSSQGGSTNFGDLPEASNSHGGVSDSTRGVIAGYYPSYSGQMDYVTIATTGDTSDFGELMKPNTICRGGINSPTRGVYAGVEDPSTRFKRTEYITIQTKGNSQEFGELTDARTGIGMCSNSTRGLVMSGLNPSLVNTIDYCTIATLGNFTDFGDTVVARRSGSSCSNSIRGLYGGGTTPANLNMIDYVTIATTADAKDFGDLTYSARGVNANSDSHGGLG